MFEEFTYIGTKIVRAVKCTKMNYEGCTQEQLETEKDIEGYKVTYEDGYVSWSPKDTFERSYRMITDKEADLIGKQKR